MAAPDLKQSVPPLKRHVSFLYGVGPERAAQLARLKVSTVEDVLLLRPRRYEDRRHSKTIAEMTQDEPATTRGKIVAMGLKTYRQRRKSVFEIILEDSTGRLHCRWWNLPFMEKYFKTGDEVFAFGRLIGLKPRTMDHPETEVIEAGEESSIHINRIAPIYPLTEGLPQRWVRGLVWRTVQQFGAAIESNENTPPHPVPLPRGEGEKGGSDAEARRLNPEAAEISRNADQRSATQQTGSLRYPEGFLTRAQAIQRLHFPESPEDEIAAVRRLALDEFIELQRDIKARRDRFEARSRGLPSSGDNRLMKPFLRALNFKLTEAQTRVLRELRQDLGGAHPMRRLLQGDVGSGKTVVAACTALMALESGFNVALMAPTEILASQHFENFKKWFEPLGIEVLLRTGSVKSVPKNPRAPALVVGTHALIQQGFGLSRLGLVIIDEQHKFGVTQREELVRKGAYPHLLVMTATPIPRTLGLTLYGELDVSVIDELPAGRGKIQTFVRTADRLPQVWEFIRGKLAEGRQAFVVYPRVEDTSGGLKAVKTEFANIQKQSGKFHAGLLHGRLGAAERERVMDDFRANRVQVLLATPLIEVGVDVPNATIMLIENAEQFGLAQLHQLRGRIGRGAHHSFCILVAAAKNLEARERLQVLEDTSDGFKIAEADLKIRGPGELLGQQQSGLPPFKFGDLVNDWDLIALARKIVRPE